METSFFTAYENSEQFDSGDCSRRSINNDVAIFFFDLDGGFDVGPADHTMLSSLEEAVRGSDSAAASCNGSISLN